MSDQAAELAPAAVAESAVIVNSNSDATRTLIPGRNGGQLRPFDSAASQAANYARWHKAERINRKAMADAAGVSTWDQALYEGTKSEWAKVLAGGKGSTQAYNAVMRAAGLLRERASDGGQVAGAVTDEQAQALRLLADGLLDRMRADPELAARLRAKLSSE